MMQLPPRVSRIPLMLLSFEEMEKLGKRFRALGKTALVFRPSVKHDLKGLGLEITPQHYAAGCLFSGLGYGLVIFGLAMLLLVTRSSYDQLTILRWSVALGVVFTTMFFMLHLTYPKILINKIAAQEDKDLLYALREIMTEIDGGVPLFDAMKEVSRGGYGVISMDFTYVVTQIESGVAMKDALRELALATKSEFLRRALWQMVNALETGASMSIALPNVVQSLESNALRDIRKYSTSLNFLMLIYMLVAASIPSLGITFLVLLSAFSGIGVTATTIGMLVGVSLLGQLVMIGYMGSTRPEVFGG